MSSVRFRAMIAVSAVVMLGLIGLNRYALNQTAWMTLVMGAVMTAVMLGLIWTMYEGQATNFALSIAAAAVFLVAIWATRNQEPSSDFVAQATIPQHSTAILANERARFADPRVSPIADSVIETQEREISAMKQAIADRKVAPTSGGTRSLPPASMR